MRRSSGLIGWGVFLIVLGVEALLVRAGVLDAALARRALELWPLVLVGIGLELVLRRTPAAALGTVVMALVFALLAGGLLAMGPVSRSTSGFCGAGNLAASPHPAASGTFGDAAAVKVTANCGTLNLTAADGKDWTLGWASSDDRAPGVTATAGSLNVQPADGTAGPFSIGGATALWSLTLPRDPVLELDLSLNAGTIAASLDGLRASSVTVAVNAGQANLDMSKVSARDIARVDGTVNAGSLTITLPALVGTLTGHLIANAGTLRLCAPAGAGLRLTVADEVLATDNFAALGLVQEGNIWTSPGFGTTDSRIDLVVSANVGTITLDPEDGCE